MAGQMAGRDQHHVESERQSGEVGPRQQKGRRSPGDAAALPWQHPTGGAGEVAAGLDLDNGEHLPAARQDVDFTRWATPIDPGAPPKAPPPMPAAQKIRAASATLRLVAAR